MAESDRPEDREFEAMRRKVRANLNLDKRRAALGDANGAVYVPGRPGYVYVREKQATGLGSRKEVRLHPNANVRIEPGVAVLLGYDNDNELCVLQADFTGQLQQGGNPWANNPLDPAFSFVNQVSFMTLICHSTSPLSLSVMARAWIYIQNDTVYGFTGALVDLTSSVPSAGNHLLAGIFIKTDQTTEVALSTAQSILDPLDLTDVQECINGKSAGSTPCWFWRLYGGQTVVNDKVFPDGDSFLDGRQIVNIPVYPSSLYLPYLGSATYKSLEDMNTVIHSTGVVTGGGITDNGNGTVAVAAGSGVLRKTNSDVATLYFVDWPASGSVSLTDASQNFIYIKYNAGTNDALLEVLTSESSDYNTRFMLCRIYRNGTTLHIFTPARFQIGNHAALMFRSMAFGMGVMRESGGVISEVGTRQFSITAGAWWYGLTRFTTSAFDGTSGSFSYFYRNGAGGWTVATAQTAINNTQYDDGDGTLGTLSNNKYGVHWVYLGADNDVQVQYGQGDYTLTEAQMAQAPATAPQLATDSFLVGKIIIKKSDAAFTSIEDAFSMFGLGGGASATDHNSLSGLQGGTASQYYHLTQAGYDTLSLLDHDVELVDTATGPGLEVQTTDGSAFGAIRSNFNTVIGPAATARTIRGKTGTPSSSTSRWDIVPGDATAEGGSNVGSDLAVYRYDDSGVFIDSILTAYRSTGRFLFAQNVMGGAVDPRTFDARLTLTSATPVTTSDVTAATTLYLALYGGDRIALWDSTLSVWSLITLTEKSIKSTDTQTGTLNATTTVTGLTDTSQLVVGMQITGTNIPANTTIATIASATSITMNNAATGSGSSSLTFKLPPSTVYDVFCYLDTSYAPKLEFVAWSNSGAGTGARATALTTQNGIYAKNGDVTRRYVGTIMTTSTAGQIEDSILRRLVWNYYNRFDRKLKVTESTDSWTYTTASWRSLNNSTANRVEIVAGLQEATFFLHVFQSGTTAGNYSVGIGVNTTSANNADIFPIMNPNNNTTVTAHAVLLGHPGAIGYNWYQEVEYSTAVSGPLYGDAGITYLQTGMIGHIQG